MREPTAGEEACVGGAAAQETGSVRGIGKISQHVKDKGTRSLSVAEE